MSEPAAPVSIDQATSNARSSSDSNPSVSNPPVSPNPAVLDSAVSNAELWAAVDRYYAGDPDPDQLRAGVGSALLLVPVRSLREFYTVSGQGLRWILAFSSEIQLSRFAHQRPARLPPPYWYLTIRGRRLFTRHTTGVHSGTYPSISPGVSTERSTQGWGPAGVALDIAGAQPMLFSPLFNLDRPTPSEQSSE